ncbi:OpgC family protein [Roseobacter sinensis]|uniref:OpgC domain-containing protein n=1 Tax=Roseobacter sinensis TaxID=2931391 RepID=A0ABT3BF92_9RHOB|nr:OpgC domain-containing protein [Roseobacter sp. WL0113]MCV3272256.1 OpgC domain-containing protein [Roseobacter sp. WL0113]
MTVADPIAMAPRKPPAAARSGLDVRQRDVRLDFFRGIAMFIILFAHTPGNFFTSWIPARWGFSDATEIFVFCSGMASAIAFGRAYDTVGWRLGTARVSFRIWQVYWAHIGLFFAVATFLAAIDMTGAYETVYIGTLNLWSFFQNPGPQLVGLLTLTYVPNYFDILPMYMVVLMMMPLIMALSRIHLGLVAAFIGLTWLFAQGRLLGAVGLEAAHLALPADPSSERRWYFNPFGWQLVFFTGFAFMRGWLPKPPVHPMLIGIALALVLANIPLSHIGIRELGFDWARDWRSANNWLINKSDFGVLRYVHFLALAYLCWVAAGDKGARLVSDGVTVLGRIWQRILAIILKVGQQSLAVFITSMFVARVSGFVMDNIGRDTWTVVAVNFAGMGILVLVAYGAGWYKSQPWRKKVQA